jgi:thiamine-phosphate pyrophosphorylase
LKTDRAVDANLNRAQEALRVLEDAARFILCNDTDAEKLKSLRHALHPFGDSLMNRLLTARDSRGDGNAHLNPPTEMSREGLPALITANAKRAEQALRSLEEFAKLPNAILRQRAATYKRIRFELYTLEEELTSKVLRNDKRRYLRGLYVVLDPDISDGRNVTEIAKQALGGGVRLIQLRDKQWAKGRKLELSRKLKAMAAQAGALFIVNDDADVALLAQADGVHLGQSDLPAKEVRGLLPVGAMIGVSTHNVSEALKAEKDGADYISVGCLFATNSKKDVHPTSLKVLREIRKAVRLPIAGIGGINSDNIAQVYEAGADMAAVISAIGLAENPSEMIDLLSRDQTKLAVEKS